MHLLEFLNLRFETTIDILQVLDLLLLVEVFKVARVLGLLGFFALAAHRIVLHALLREGALLLTHLLYAIDARLLLQLRAEGLFLGARVQDRSRLSRGLVLEEARRVRVVATAEEGLGN